MVFYFSEGLILLVSKYLGGTNMRVNVTLECTECGDRNYITTKNKRNDEGRIEMKKYCPRLRKVTLHRETKGKN